MPIEDAKTKLTKSTNKARRHKNYYTLAKEELDECITIDDLVTKIARLTLLNASIPVKYENNKLKGKNNETNSELMQLTDSESSKTNTPVGKKSITPAKISDDNKREKENKSFRKEEKIAASPTKKRLQINDIKQYTSTPKEEDILKKKQLVDKPLVKKSSLSKKKTITPSATPANGVTRSNAVTPSTPANYSTAATPSTTGAPTPNSDGKRNVKKTRIRKIVYIFDDDDDEDSEKPKSQEADCICPVCSKERKLKQKDEAIHGKSNGHSERADCDCGWCVLERYKKTGEIIKNWDNQS